MLNKKHWLIVTCASMLSISNAYADHVAQNTFDVTTVNATVVGTKLAPIDLLDGSGVSCGKVNITDNRVGPDAMIVKITERNCLPSFTKITVLLTQSPTLGSLPAQFVGEFTTDSRGLANYSVVTEVVDAFASANQSFENELGVADIFAAGARGNGANTIPLDWVRMYIGDGDQGFIDAVGGSVFGHADTVLGGALNLTTAAAIPSPALDLNVDASEFVYQFATKSLADQHIASSNFFSHAFSSSHTLYTDASTGNILKYDIAQISGPAVTVSQSTKGVFRYSLPVSEDLSGRQISFNITATDHQGNTSSEIVTQRIFRSAEEAPLNAQHRALYITYPGGGLSCGICTGDIASYEWKVLGLIGFNKPDQLGSPTGRSTTIRLPEGSLATVQLTITDANGNRDTTRVQVTTVSRSQLRVEQNARFTPTPR